MDHTFPWAISDGFGAAGFFQRMFGTKIYLGAPDARMFRQTPYLSMIQESGNCMDTLADIDVEIEDGDFYRFGNVEVKFRLVPGHTKGCIACFFEVTMEWRKSVPAIMEGLV